MPHFYPGEQANNFWYRYEALGRSPGAAIANMLVHPWILFTTFFTLDRLYYLAGLVRSVGFLPLLAPVWLLPALPSLAVNLLSTDPLLYSGVYHYNAAIIPFVILAAIHGTRRLILIWQGWRHEEDETVEGTIERDKGGQSGSKSYSRNTSPSQNIVGAGLAPALHTKTLSPAQFSKILSPSLLVTSILAP